MTPRSLLFLAAFALAAACAPVQSDAPLRSPSRDYKPPPPTTSDGEVVGADEVAPGDRLEEGAGVGNDRGVLAPGWEVDKKGARYDKKKRVGGSVEQQEEKDH